MARPNESCSYQTGEMAFDAALIEIKTTKIATTFAQIGEGPGGGMCNGSHGVDNFITITELVDWLATPNLKCIIDGCHPIPKPASLVFPTPYPMHKPDL